MKKPSEGQSPWRLHPRVELPLTTKHHQSDGHIMFTHCIGNISVEVLQSSGM